MSRERLGAEGWKQLSDFLSGTGSGTARTKADAYEHMRARLASFFRWKGCIAIDEYVDATFDRVARTLAEGVQVRERSEPSKYMLGVARLIYLEGTKKEIRQKKAERFAGEEQAVPPDIHQKARLRAMEDCLKLLPGGERATLLHYHQSEGGARITERKALAEKEGMALNTLRIRMHRLRLKLADCVRGKIS